jgi:hypothetical protein
MTRNVAVNAVEFRRLVRPVVTYGCSRCQCEHTEGDELFAPHLHRQAKHHYSERSATPADVLRRVRESGN